jgi:hypothetical protein
LALDDFRPRRDEIGQVTVNAQSNHGFAGPPRLTSIESRKDAIP